MKASKRLNLKHLLILATFLPAFTAQGKNVQGWEDYSNDVQSEKMEARRACLNAAKPYYFANRDYSKAPLLSFEGMVRVSGDFDKFARKFVWNGHRIVMQRVNSPRWYTERDCKEGLIKGPQCKPRLEAEVLWTSQKGVLDNGNSVMLGPAMDNIISYVLSTSANISARELTSRKPEERKRVEALRVMNERCRGLTSVMVGTGKNRLHISAFIERNEKRIAQVLKNSGQANRVALKTSAK